MIHRIRLKPAWKAFRQGPDVVVWRRVFHCPTGLGDRTQVWLVIEGEPPPKILRLNGNFLFQEGSLGIDRDSAHLRFEIQSQLIPGRNTLELVLTMREQTADDPCPQATDSPLRPVPVEVYLEIQEDTAE